MLLIEHLEEKNEYERVMSELHCLWFMVQILSNVCKAALLSETEQMGIKSRSEDFAFAFSDGEHKASQCCATHLNRVFGTNRILVVGRSMEGL